MTDAGGGGARWRLVGPTVAALAALVVAENLGARPLDQLLLYAPGIDKILHFLQSAVILRVLHVVLQRVRLAPRLRLVVASGLTLALAAFDEAQQMLAPGRHIEYADVAAGCCGAALSAALLMEARRRRIATAIGVAAVAGAAAIAFHSYTWTRDVNRGHLLQASGRHAEAHASFRRALDLGVRDAGLFNLLAWTAIEADAGEPELAVDFARQSLELEPGVPDALDTYGWALYRAGRYEEAREPLEQALAGDPSIYCIHFHLGATYLALRRRDAALTHLRRQAAEFPKTKEARLAEALLTREFSGADEPSRR